MQGKIAEQKNIAVSKAELFELQNTQGVKMCFSSCGAAIVSLWVPDKRGRLADIVLGYDDAGQYLTDEYYIGTVVGRYANRIAGQTVTIDNKKYTLRSKFEGFHHHGGVEGFNRKLFNGTRFKNDNASGVVFTYTSADQEEGYPGEFQLEVKYTLTDNNEWIVEFRAVTDQTTIVNLTQHAYFNLAGHSAGNTDTHYLQIFAEYYLPVNKLQLPTGVLAPVEGTVFDFRVPREMVVQQPFKEEQLQLSGGYDHSFVLKTEHSDELKYAARVQEPASGRIMEVWTTEPAVHFYAGNFLENVNGKQGVIYQPRAGFCLETQHFPDSPNHPHFPSTVLKPNDVFYSKTIFRFS